MRKMDNLEPLFKDVHSETIEAVISEAKRHLQAGEYGNPAGVYLLKGGKAALKAGCLADAVVLLYHGLKVAEPNTKLWAEMLVNRASACAKHGFYRDAITAAEQFLGALVNLPSEATKYIPYAYHAMGFAYDKLREYANAAIHFRLAAEAYEDLDQRTKAICDLAWALTLSGQVDEAEHVLSQVHASTDPFVAFVLNGTSALVYYHQRRFAEAVAAAERAEVLAMGHEAEWIDSLTEVQYWLSRAVWELGDRYRAAAVSLRVAIIADQHWNLDLRDRANEWLEKILAEGGIQNA